MREGEWEMGEGGAVWKEGERLQGEWRMNEGIESRGGGEWKRRGGKG